MTDYAIYVVEGCLVMHIYILYAPTASDSQTPETHIDVNIYVVLLTFMRA